ncbi:DUF397 domain-containing protein [Actinoplanes sp. NBRC 103695]|uniref:DUF397 domain-containing protein n=1 Tax=Actinoplanes sp. NBRC 103695 TaxID=3032202 RepID=UPI0024A3F4BB|nr:DUF397 domain-containing protein [Actinoplanes sp. NBRC 103695]GLZ00761.1 DUF397 domain-containing protein [Actinoplanes sp. NBRC 103695]
MSPYISFSGRVYRLFRKSSKSTGTGNCVEIGVADDGTVAIRDSKDPTGPVLELTPSAFGQFLVAIRTGVFDHPQ